MTNNNDIGNATANDADNAVAESIEAGDAAKVEESTGEVNSVQSEVEALKEALAKAEQKATENYELALRTKAEAENMRRRQENELSNARKYGVEKFAQELLPVIDSMEMGLVAALDESSDVAKFREGSEMAIKMFKSVLEKFGAVAIDPQGEKFDPEYHQAMSMVENHEVPANTVLNVVQKGYKLHDRLIRPAMVIVSKGGPSAPPSSGNIDEIV